MLDILYQDDDFIAVNKPSGLLVHRSPIDKRETQFALQTVRNMVGQHVYPVHRLDKPTSGVLIFGLTQEAAQALGPLFMSHEIKKEYLAVVRGYFPESITVDHPLKDKFDKYAHKTRENIPEAKEAKTIFHCLAQAEFEESIDKYPTSRYSLVLAEPITGRKHQIRRHLKHLSHPIIGDPKYGKSRHNQFFQKCFSSQRLLLACIKMSFRHPFTGQDIEVKAPISEDFLQVVDGIGWSAQYHQL